MKKFIALLSLLLISLASSGKTPHRASNLQGVLNEYVVDMEREFQLHFVGHTLTKAPKLKKIAIDFYEYGEAEISEGRFLIYQATKDLLKRINNCSYVRPFLDHYPLNENDIEVNISFLDPRTHKGYPSGKLAHATLLNGTIHYSEYPFTKHRAKTVHLEKYLQLSK